MSRAFAIRVVAFGAASAVVLVAAAAPSGAVAPAADPGVSSSEIVIGTTTPLTGPASPGYKDVAPASQAYFDYVNANGGINGRKIKFVVKDDQYNPAKTKSATSELILRDKVFAIFAALGTPSHSAVVADINRRGIPDVFVNTGSSNFDNPAKYPTTFPYFPSYVVEAKVMASYIQSDAGLNGKKRCLFYQDGEFGENAEKGFNAAGMKFDTTVSYFSGQQVQPFASQVTKLKSAGCDLVVFFGVTSATANLLGTSAKLAFKPTWMITSVGSDPSVVGALAGGAGILSGVYTPSFLVPIQDSGNAFVSQMKVIADKSGLPWNFYTYYGINTAYVLSQALKAAGPNLTRKGLINALQTRASTFRSAAVVPMLINSRSHQGLTGYYMGQYDGSGQLVRKTSYVLLANSAATGTAKKALFRPGSPTPKLLP